MKEVLQGLESEDSIEATILCSRQFKSILKKYCGIDVVIQGNNHYAILVSSVPRDKNEAIKLIMDIREGRLKDDPSGVINIETS